MRKCPEFWIKYRLMGEKFLARGCCATPGMGDSFIMSFDVGGSDLTLGESFGHLIVRWRLMVHSSPSSSPAGAEKRSFGQSSCKSKPSNQRAQA